jgi:hypothetical protein
MKSKFINLTIILALLSSCSTSPNMSRYQTQHVYMRADSTAKYNQNSRRSSGYAAPIVYHHFKSTGYWDNGTYHRTGYHSNSISKQSNVGSSPSKSKAVTRSGFGSSARSHSVSS